MFGVGVKSGATLFTRMPSGPSSTASERANCSTAALAAEYTVKPGAGAVGFDRGEVDDAAAPPTGTHAGDGQVARMQHVKQVHAQQRVPTLSGWSP